MVEHMVIFKFGPETTEEQISECVRRARTLRDDIKGIIDLAAGSNFSDRSQGFQVGLTVRFEDKRALSNYTPHPKHQEFVAFTMEIGRKDIIVVDFEL
ncbi:Dabb family protein [Alicyclobacillus dauci]|uniref:Dabb family protein n=1 Tax=Alicyclobacillus dauci TaxID=1475485 RepID=A0ABY6Z8U6_9BACL|nr:Dabb family protein [Alicyclobacillus dauci]WAH38676.1 Dabb family protein [Alicyclobacillus dauci]